MIHTQRDMIQTYTAIVYVQSEMAQIPKGLSKLKGKRSEFKRKMVQADKEMVRTHDL